MLLRKRGDENACVVGPYDIAWIDGAKADAAGKGRGYGCVAKIGLGGFNHRFIRLDERAVHANLGGELIHRLLRCELLLGKRAGAFEVLEIAHKLRLVLRLLGLCLIERRLEKPGVDGGEHLVLLDVLTFLEVHPVERAIDAAAQLHGIERLNRADAG